MTWFRAGLVLGLTLVLALFLTLVLAYPAVLPFIGAFRGGTSLDLDLSRLVRLATTTSLLVIGVLILALPIGVAQAELLFRTNLPWRRVFLLLNLLLLLLPLPLHIMGWQAFLGPDGWLALWLNAPGRPWIEGLTPAILIHAVAATPWVVLIVGAGLASVERELEEQALFAGGPWHVLWSTTLPRCRGAIVAAAVWVVLQTVSEVAVTEMLLVNTCAEEIRMRFILGGANLPAALTLAVPMVGTAWLILVLLRPVFERGLAPLQNNAVPPLPLDLQKWRWPLAILLIAWWLLIFAGPTLGLVERAGRVGNPVSWQASEVWRRSAVVLNLHGGKMAASLLCAVTSGLVAALLALLVSWAMLSASWFRTFAWSLAGLCWVTPGPAVGLGLKDIIDHVVHHWPNSSLAWTLYHSGPTPILWAHVIRFFPCALVIIWPVVRMTAMELRDAARLVSPVAGFHLAIWPTARRAFWVAVMAVSALALGEVGAAAMVANPGSETFTKLLLDMMHTGLDNNVAAMGLCLLLGAAGLGLVFGIGCRVFKPRSPTFGAPPPGA